MTGFAGHAVFCILIRSFIHFFRERLIFNAFIYIIYYMRLGINSEPNDSRLAAYLQALRNNSRGEKCFDIWKTH